MTFNTGRTMLVINLTAFGLASLTYFLNFWRSYRRRILEELAFIAESDDPPRRPFAATQPSDLTSSTNSSQTLRNEEPRSSSPGRNRFKNWIYRVLLRQPLQEQNDLEMQEHPIEQLAAVAGQVAFLPTTVQPTEPTSNPDLPWPKPMEPYITRAQRYGIIHSASN